MRMYTRVLNTVLVLFALPLVALAQNGIDTVPPAGNEGVAIIPELTAVITSDSQVEIGKNIIFDGGQSVNPEHGRKMTFGWDFGDHTGKESGAEVVHTYGKPGTYTVILTVNNGVSDTNTTKKIVAYSRLILLFTGHTADGSLVNSVVEYAAGKGTYVDTVQNAENQSDYLSSQSLVNLLSANAKDIRAATIIMVWTGSTASLGALSDFIKNLPADEPLDVSHKTFIFITSDSLAFTRRIAEGTFRTIMPERIILTRPAALHTIVDAATPEDITMRLAATGLDFAIVDQVSSQVSPWNFMSYLVDYMRNKGVPDNTIFLILILPLIATIVTFIRQVVGISTAGIYAPAIITISFIAVGLWTGILVFAVILIASSFGRFIVKRFNIMYIPRMAIAMTVTALAIFLLLLTASYFGIQSITAISIFPLLILITMAEKFLNVITERGVRSSLFLMGETLIVSVICYVLVNQWSAFYTFTLAYPEMIFVLIIINFLLGRWTGLRLTELFRFRQILNSVEHAEEENE